MEMTVSIASLAVSLFAAAFALYSFFWMARRDCRQATLEAYNRLPEQVLDHLNLYMPSQIREIAKNNRSE